MDKVMNEKIHLAEKKGRVTGRSLLSGEPKKRENEDSEKYVRQQTSRSELNVVWQQGKRWGEQASKQETENKESKEICSNSLWMCSGACTIPRLMNRLTLQKRKQSENLEMTERRGIGEIFTQWVVLCCIPLCHSQQGVEERALYSLIPALWSLLSRRTVPRLGLSVDLPEGSDSTKLAS